MTGYRARGDVAYRTSRYATTGVAYDFTHYEYTKGFGGSDIHTVAFTQAFRMGRYWELSMRAGGSRVETLGLIQVAIDPVIAAIIGTSQGIQVIYRINWVPAAKLLLTRKFHYSTLTFDYDRGVVPGNGLYLTSRQESATGNFSYTGLQKVNIGISGGHLSYGSLTQTVGNYSGFTGGAGLTYKISGPFHFILRYDYRRYDIAATVFQRDSYRASIGFGFSPKDVPLSLW
jgi:opacity protein-like surface antigen